ncbi:Fumarate hydratase class II [uncultured archaeon]|nr:Fumarate hydratase class II [uncultured archaeon]
MNCNEVVANRALELLGKKRGDYVSIHPNNDVNKSQSSNDVVPTAIRLALLMEHPRLVQSVSSIRLSLQKKGKQYAKVIQTGRTHLQDAVPLSIQQVFDAYARDFELDEEELNAAASRLLELGIGGTAVGTGINTHPKFRAAMVKQLAKNTGLALTAGQSPVELTSNMNAFLAYAHAMARLAVSFERLSKDLQLLASGPRAGIGEFRLPEVEPGSSIMPGKINPSIAEAAQMAAAQAIAHVNAVESGCRGGQLQLNMMTPLIARNALDAQELLTNSLDMMREKCVNGIVVDVVRVDSHLMEGLIVATALAPKFGYTQVSEWIKEADKRRIGIRELLVEKGVMPKNELDAALDPKKMIGPSQ